MIVIDPASLYFIWEELERFKRQEDIRTCRVLLENKLLVFAVIWGNQCCGSGFYESGPLRILIQQFKWIRFPGLHKERPSYRSSHQPSKENIKHFKRWNFINCFLFFCFHFYLLDPDTDPGTPSNPDPDPQHWRKLKRKQSGLNLFGHRRFWVRFF